MSTDAIDSLYVLFGLDKNAQPVEPVRRLLGPAVPRRPRAVVHLLPDAGLRGHRPDACRGRSRWSASPRSSASCIGTGARRAGRLAARLLDGRAAAGDHVPVLDPVLLARPDRDHAARRPGQLLPVVGRLRAGPGAGLGQRVHRQRHPAQPAAGAHDPDLVGERLDPRHAQHDGDGRVRGLHHRRARQGPVRAPGDGQLRGPQRAAAERLRLRAVARLHRRRHAAGGDRLLLPGHRLQAVPGGRRARTTR